MLAYAWLTWWYGRGWAQTVTQVHGLLKATSRLFSVPILLRTLFAPWKRIITYPGASLDAKLRAFADNMVSRAIGFAVRLLVLVTALIMETLTLSLGAVWVIIWPLLPAAVVVLVVKGIIG
jgi:hypothetical protein